MTSEQTERMWHLHAITESIDIPAGTITLWVSANRGCWDEPQEVPITSDMPLWMIEKDAQFYAEIPRACLRFESLDQCLDILRWEILEQTHWDLSEEGEAQAFKELMQLIEPNWEYLVVEPEHPPHPQASHKTCWRCKEPIRPSLLRELCTNCKLLIGVKICRTCSDDSDDLKQGMCFNCRNYGYATTSLAGDLNDL